MNHLRLLLAALAAFTLASHASAALQITEVMSSESVGVNDWFELTNTGSSAVDITGYKMDDNSFAFANTVALNGITSIAAGESVVFIEDAGTGVAAFKTLWNLGSGIQVGSYSGSGVGLSSSGDGVVVFTGTGVEVNRVTFGAATAGESFYYNGNSLLTDLSAVGQKGAYASAATGGLSDVASPGVNVTAVPEPSTYGLMGAVALSATVLVRRRRTGMSK